MAYSDSTLEMACMSLALDLNEETELFAGIIKSGLGQCVAEMVGTESSTNDTTRSRRSSTAK